VQLESALVLIFARAVLFYISSPLFFFFFSRYEKRALMARACFMGPDTTQTENIVF
jgi:hypothetical protein